MTPSHWCCQLTSPRVLPELVLLGIIIVSTVLYQAPQHARLSSGFDAAAYRTLVRSNWVRTVTWSAFGVLDLWLIAQAVPMA